MKRPAATARRRSSSASTAGDGATWAPYDPRLRALNQLQVPSIERRLQVVRDRLTVAMGLIHAASTVGGAGLPGEACTTAEDLCASAARALQEAAVEARWLARLPAEVIDSPAPDDEQLAGLREQRIAFDDALRQVAVAESARLRAIFSEREAERRP